MNVTNHNFKRYLNILIVIVIWAVVPLFHNDDYHGFVFTFVDAWAFFPSGEMKKNRIRLGIVGVTLSKDENNNYNQINSYHHIKIKSIKKDNYINLIRNDCEDSTHLDYIHQHLCSPAPESYQVIQNAVNRLNDYHEQNYNSNNLTNHAEFNINNSNTLSTYQRVDENNDKMTTKLILDIYSLSYLVKRNHQILIKVNHRENNKIDTKSKPTSYTWDIVESNELPYANIVNQLVISNHSTQNINKYKIVNNNILELSRSALNMATNMTNENLKDEGVVSAQIHKIAHQAKERLLVTQGTDLRGRLSADAAFNFAMAGVSGTVGESLLSSLLQVASNELKRSGHRKSFKANNIFHMLEKFASTGILDFHNYSANNGSISYQNKFLSHTTTALQAKGYSSDTRGREINFFDENSLMWLWRFSTRQPKSNLLQPTQLSVSAFPNFDELFDDPTKPLVMDVGCGMGISMLGLSTLSKQKHNYTDDVESGVWEGENGSNFWKSNNFNFLGIDTNPLFTRFAKGVYSRLDTGTRRNVNFVASDALEFLEYTLSHYPGTVRMVMIQFPTPYRLKKSAITSIKHASNLQLPDSNDGFMVTPQLIDITYQLLAKSLSHEKGYLLLQSNCEDVALKMRNMVLSHPFNDNSWTKSKLVDFGLEHTMTENDIIQTSNKRTRDWLEICHNQQQKRPMTEDRKQESAEVERAVGIGWSKGPILPLLGRTETEIHHMRNKAGIHRCLFSFSKDNDN